MSDPTSSPPPSGRLPTFLIVGGMRCGTTSLAKHLGAHPDVYLAPGKELHFFDREHDRGVDWYRGRFDGADGQAHLGEATPAYLLQDRTMDRMVALLPDVRLFVLLREPVSRAYSHYWHQCARGREHRSFTEVARAEVALGIGDRSGYLGRGDYLPQLEALCERYDRAALHVTLLDDLRDDPDAAMSAAYRHLGVDDAFVPPRQDRSYNGYVHFRSPTVYRLQQRLSGRARLVVGRLNSVRRPYPPIPDELDEELHAAMAPRNAALAAWLGTDLGRWERSARRTVAPPQA